MEAAEAVGQVPFLWQAQKGVFVRMTGTGVSDVATVHHGVDTFAIHDDTIRLQTAWFNVVLK